MTERMYLKPGRHTLFASSLFCAAIAAQAAGLGEATLRSGLSQPLRVEIALVGDDVSALGNECFRVLTPSGSSDDLPWVRSAQMRLEQTGNRHILVVTTRQAIQDPALMLGVQMDCGVQVRREYALLLGPAAVEAPRTLPAESAAALPPARPAAARGRVETWTAAEGESAASIAAALIPGDRAAQRRIAREIVRANPELFAGNPNATQAALAAGTQLQVPMPGARPAPRSLPPEADPQKPAPERRASPPERPAELAALPRPRRDAPRPTDRLTVTADDADGSLRQSLELDESRRQTVPDESTRSRLRREQQLILAIDDRIATTLELNERIRQLEAAQQRLQAENQRLAGLIAQQSGASSAPARLTSTATPIDWRLIAGGALLVLVAIAGSLAWRRRRIRVLPVEPLPAAGNPDSTPEEEDAEFEGEEPLTAADIWPEREGAPPSAGPLNESIDWTPPTLSPGALGPSSLLHIDDEVEEHDSAVELAEIMMSFGRVQGAAETLADFIRANPKQAVRPWIKLLEVYKAASMRVEFDALAGQLNKTFNVKAVTWEEFDQVKEANESVEQMGHIIGRILNTWRTRECQVYLHTLLRDNRKGTRQGFPLGIVDDILCLNGVLEIELGPFKPTPEELLAMETPPPPPAEVPSPSPVAPAVTAATPAQTTEDEISFDEHALPPSRPRAPAPTFEPERTESMIEFNLDEDLPPLKPRDQ